jgi:hypothetical protein
MASTNAAHTSSSRNSGTKSMLSCDTAYSASPTASKADC